MINFPARIFPRIKTAFQKSDRMIIPYTAEPGNYFFFSSGLTYQQNFLFNIWYQSANPWCKLSIDTDIYRIRNKSFGKNLCISCVKYKSTSFIGSSFKSLWAHLMQSSF